MKSCSRGKMLSRGSTHRGGRRRSSSQRVARPVPEVHGSSQQRKLLFLFMEPSFLKEGLFFFLFCCYPSKATQVKPKSFPHASIHVDKTTLELERRATAPQAKLGGQQPQWSPRWAAGHTVAPPRKEAGGRGEDYDQQ